MKASIVISTYNRASFLAESLSSLEGQTYRNFEVLVVNGPSTDNTDAILQTFAGRIKVLHCSEPNLSKSRNIGIAASSGDVCAFIDDDAVAHPNWLERIMAPYADSNVYGVGGFTLDHTGVNFQCRYTVCDRLGNAHFFEGIDPANFINFPGSYSFPSLLGTNSSFRRSALFRIGGFDEVFSYMLDETDVCLRLNDLGGRLLTVPEALILHRYAPSHTRTVERIPKSLLAPARSKAYFCFKHRRTVKDISAQVDELSKFSEELLFSTRWFVDHEKITPAHFLRLTKEIETGVVEGTSLAVGKPRSTDALASKPAATPFLPFPLEPARAPLRICLVSQGYPPLETAGIARWTAELAHGLTKMGHRVHVIASTAGSHTVEYQAGIWVHRVPNGNEIGPSVPTPVPSSIYQRALAVYKEAVRIQEVWGLDIVSAPIWDVEGLVCAAHLDIPVVTSLHTTYKLALPFKEHWKKDLEYRHKHVDRIIAAERWLLKHSSLILGNSDAIIREIEAAYLLELERSNLAIVPHGVAVPQSHPQPTRRLKARTKFLFVGRLERRKGVDLLLTAAIPLLLKYPDADLHIVGEEVLGDMKFDDQIRTLRAAIAANNLEDRVVFHGYVADEELLAHYASCDVFIAPSRFESFGLIAIEAMRFGKPVIASDAGGLGEIFENGIDGLLFHNEDADDLQAALERLAESATLRSRIGKRAKASFLRKYTVDAMAQAVSEAYANVAAPVASGATPDMRITNDVSLVIN